jgi:hypothetical protein
MLCCSAKARDDRPCRQYGQQEVLALHDIHDAEAFAGALARDHGRRRGLSYYEQEDLYAFAVSTLWELSTRYQPGGVSFSTWAGTTLRKRLVDHDRARLGRSVWRFGDGRVHERPRPRLVSLDELGDAVAPGSSDPPASRDADLLGLVEERGRCRSRDLDALGLGAARRASR